MEQSQNKEENSTNMVAADLINQLSPTNEEFQDLTQQVLDFRQASETNHLKMNKYEQKLEFLEKKLT